MGLPRLWWLGGGNVFPIQKNAWYVWNWRFKIHDLKHEWTWYNHLVWDEYIPCNNHLPQHTLSYLFTFLFFVDADSFPFFCLKQTGIWNAQEVYMLTLLAVSAWMEIAYFMDPLFFAGLFDWVGACSFKKNPCKLALLPCYKTIRWLEVCGMTGSKGNTKSHLRITNWCDVLWL